MSTHSVASPVASFSSLSLSTSHESTQTPQQLSNPQQDLGTLQTSSSYSPSKTCTVFCSRASLDVKIFASLLMMRDQEEVKTTIETPPLTEKTMSMDTAEKIYKAIVAASPQHPFRRGYNLDRYTDISVFADNRCLLSENSFVHASPHLGCLPHIFTQGPLPNTLDDFAELILLYNVSTIVTLANPIEGGRHKTANYWQGSMKSDKCAFVSVDGSLSEIGTFKDTPIYHRKLDIKFKSMRRVVDHYWLKNWIDGSTTDCDPLLKLCDTVHKSVSGVLLSHCSGGIGRVGVFGIVTEGMCLIDQKKPVSIPKILLSFRNSRANMVQSPAQLRLAHETLALYNQAHHTD